MDHPIGTRVGAFASVKGGTVLLFGYGTYLGDEIPPDEGDPSLTGVLHAAGIANPKIRLDHGEIIWGCECWWNTEDFVKEMIQTEGLTIVELSVADFRAGHIPEEV